MRPGKNSRIDSQAEIPQVAVIFCYHCLRETVDKQDKEKTKRRRIVAFVNWKMPKLAHILKSL